MGMSIVSNVQAVNARRNLNMTSIKMGRALERVASGLRINRAADDAAGLAISEKLRSQVRGMQQASRNAQDGISMVQTAEGALAEVHSILQRQRELVVQAGNSSLSGSDRTAIGEELLALKNEIDRISTATSFNGQNLLTGTLTTALDGASELKVGTAVATALAAASELKVGTAVATALAAASELKVGTAISNNTISAMNLSTADAGTTFTFTYNAGTNDLTLTNTTTAAFETIVFGSAGGAGDKVLNFATLGVSVTLNGPAEVAADDLGNALAAAGTNDIITAANVVTAVDVSGADAGTTYTFTYAAGTNALTLTNATTSVSQTITFGTAGVVGDKVLNFGTLGISVILTGPAEAAADDLGNALAAAGTNDVITAAGSGAASFQVGANAGQTIAVGFSDMRASAIGSGAGNQVSDKITDNQAVSTTAKADALIVILDDAIADVSTQRGALGAVQNRMESTINALGVSIENLGASEGRIRDADIAAVSSELVTAQILQQAGLSVLSQANQAPQAALALLQ